MRLQKTVVADKPLDAVFGYLSDFTTTTGWDPGTVVTVNQHGDGGVGTTYLNTSTFLGRQTQLTYIVREFVPGQRIQLCGQNKTVTAVDTMTFRSVEAGTEVTYTAEFTFKARPVYSPHCSGQRSSGSANKRRPACTTHSTSSDLPVPAGHPGANAGPAPAPRQRHQDRQEPPEEAVTNAISRDPASHGGISGLVPAAGYDRASWRESAACRQAADPELFFPIGPAGIARTEIQRAKAICASCPVRQPCLTFALATRQEFGIWGGHDENERRLLHRQQRESRTAAGR